MHAKYTGIFVLQNSKLRQISKSPDDIHTRSSDSGGAQKNDNHILGPKLNVTLLVLW